MSVEALVTSLEAKKVGPSQWMAKCPYHDDHSPSLAISEGEAGGVLAHCHAGCDDVFNRLVRDGYLGTQPAHRYAAEQEAVYEYCDAQGELAFEVVRLPGKQFRARRPDGAGGWIWGAPEEIRVPYRLPKLIEAPDDANVFIVEGEKDVDRLVEHGYVATTAPFGAGKWRPQYNQYFAGRQVIIVPDNDEPGRKHAESVRQQLVSVAASVRVLSLEGFVESKGDVSDLIGAKGVDAFKLLVDQLLSSDLSERPYLRIEDLERLPRRVWLIDGLLPARGLALLFGNSGIGKSFVAIDMAVRVAAAERCLDRAVTSGFVFYVALEGVTGLSDRIRAAAGEVGCADTRHLPLVVRNRPLDLLKGEAVGELVTAVHRAQTEAAAQCVLVVIDTLSRAMPGADENSPGDMNRVVSALVRIQAETGATVLAIHHSGKTPERGARGHSSLRAAVDTELLVSLDRQDRTLTVTKQRDGADQIKIPFDLATVPVPGGSGDTRVVRALQAEADAPATKLGAKARKAKDALRNALRASGRPVPADDPARDEIPTDTRVVTREEWLEACRAVGLSGGSDEALRKARSRAAKELAGAGLLGEAGNYCWLIAGGQTAGGRTGQDGRGSRKNRSG